MARQWESLEEWLAHVAWQISGVLHYLATSLDPPARKIRVADHFIADLQELPGYVRDQVRSDYARLLICTAALCALDANLATFSQLPPRRKLPPPSDAFLTAAYRAEGRQRALRYS